MKQPTLWGSVFPSQYKPRGGVECSRAGCDRPRRKSGRYCRECTNEWRRLKRALERTS